MGDASPAAEATVYFCPDGERVRANTPSTKFHLAHDTTFFELLQGACMYYEQSIGDSVLRNATGSIWPVKDVVAQSLRGAEVRLTPSDKGDEEEEAEVEAVVEDVEKEEVDDGRVVAARPPLIKELILHMIFLFVLIFDTYMANTYPTYKTHSALENAFILPRNSRQPLITTTVSEAADSFNSVHTQRGMCTWLTNRMIDGLFRTDLRDAWGDVEVFNRVAGGITIQASFQRWQDWETAKEGRAPYVPFVAGFPPFRTVEFRLAPKQLALFEDTELAQEATVIFEAELDELTRGVCAYTPNATAGDDFSEVMRSLQVTMLFNNHNYDLFFLGSFLFDMKLSGQVRPYYSFRPFTLEPPWGSWYFESETGSFLAYMRFRSYLALLNFALVVMRTFNEIKASRKVFADTGSIRPYFSGVFTLLELFNLTCNYVGLGCRFYEQFQPQRLQLLRHLMNDDPSMIMETQVDMIVVISGIILTARALSIISAMLLLFKYLELAPRRYLSSFYLTGTTLARAGRDLQVVMLLFLVVILAFSIIGSEMFGAELREFSSVPTAFFTLCVCVAGSGFIYRPLRETYPFLGPLFFCIFTLTHLLVITPLFLATLNDAYAVRDEQMRQAAERRASKEASRRKEREQRLKMLKK